MQLHGRRSESGVSRDALDLEMPAVSSVITEVRAAFTELPLPPPALDDARLLVSELVANSMRHARLGPDDTIRVTAEVVDGTLRIDVIDGGGGDTPPVAGGIRPRPGADSGWGLYLVETLATRWGHGAGRYWFELEIGSSTNRRG
jgi:anti-sigma regulatory factor (Ser/Thr protein kinase)